MALGSKFWVLSGSFIAFFSISDVLIIMFLAIHYAKRHQKPKEKTALIVSNTIAGSLVLVGITSILAMSQIKADTIDPSPTQTYQIFLCLWTAFVSAIIYALYLLVINVFKTVHMSEIIVFGILSAIMLGLRLFAEYWIVSHDDEYWEHFLDPTTNRNI